MPRYRLSRAAADDLAAIFQHGVERFGLRQADDYHEGLAATFDFLADYPRAARRARKSIRRFASILTRRTSSFTRRRRMSAC